MMSFFQSNYFGLWCAYFGLKPPRQNYTAYNSLTPATFKPSMAGQAVLMLQVIGPLPIVSFFATAATAHYRPARRIFHDNAW